MNEISGFGVKVNIIASATFPAGLVITQFADDADSLDLPSIQIADKAMGVNGDLVTWSKATPLTLTLNVIPTSDDDKNLSVLHEANRVGMGKQSARDIITLVIVYPSGRTATYINGKITDGPSGDSVASAGRMKSKAYQFAFENRVLS